MDKPSDPLDYNNHEESTGASFVFAMLQNEPEAWNQFSSVWSKVLLRYFKGKKLGHESAEDLVQEVMKKLFDTMSRNQFSRDGKKKKLKHFVFMIARQQLATYIERYESKPGSPGGTDFQRQFANLPEADDSDEFETQAMMVLLEQIKEEVKPETWQAFYWNRYDSIPHKEVGERLGVTTNAARQMVHRIRERIRQELDTEIVDGE